MANVRVYLGGTGNKSAWRARLINMLNADVIDYFNPLVNEWNIMTAVKEEASQKAICDYLLCVITPKQIDVYAIAEAVNNSHACPDRTLFCYLRHDDGEMYGDNQECWLFMTASLIGFNGGHCFESLEEVADFLNRRAQKRRNHWILRAEDSDLTDGSLLIRRILLRLGLSNNELVENFYKLDKIDMDVLERLYEEMK